MLTKKVYKLPKVGPRCKYCWHFILAPRWFTVIALGWSITLCKKIQKHAKTLCNLGTPWILNKRNYPVTWVWVRHFPHLRPHFLLDIIIKVEPQSIKPVQSPISLGLCLWHVGIIINWWFHWRSCNYSLAVRAVGLPTAECWNIHWGGSFQMWWDTAIQMAAAALCVFRSLVKWSQFYLFSTLTTSLADQSALHR